MTPADWKQHAEAMRASIPARVSVADLTQILVTLTVLYPPDAEGQQWDYVEDHHFRTWAFGTIRTWQEALAFADALDAESPSGACSKARQIRAWLTQPRDFWRQGDRFRAVLACSRRIHCLCHETGSYAKTSATR